MEKKSEAITIKSKKLESEIVLYSGSPDISKELEKAQKLSPRDFYEVAGKTVPSARAMQWLANRKNIKTKIVDIESTRDYCRATVGGWIGNNPIPESNHIYKEATVEIMFDVEMATKLLQIIRKNNLKKKDDWDIGENGMPYLINPKFKNKMMDELLRMRQFALRTVVTKAERIIHSKLADVEWRDEDEMKDELAEVESVSGKKVTPPKKPSKQPKVEPEPETPEVVVEESEESDSEEPEEENTLTIIPKEIINDIEKPRDALEKILEYTVQHDLGKRVKPVVTNHYKAWETGEPSLCNIPETNIIRMVEELTGVKMKKKEKSHKCDCGKRITEAELDGEQAGFCLKCHTDMEG